MSPKFEEVDVPKTGANPAELSASTKPAPRRKPAVKKDPEDPKVKLKELEAKFAEMTMQRDEAFKKAEHYFAKLKESETNYQDLRRKIGGLIDDLTYATVGLNKSVSRIEKSF